MHEGKLPFAPASGLKSTYSRPFCPCFIPSVFFIAVAAHEDRRRPGPLSSDGRESPQPMTTTTTTPRLFLSDARVDKEEDGLVETTVSTPTQQGRGEATRGIIPPPRITPHSKLIRSPVPRAKGTRTPSPQSPRRTAAAAAAAAKEVSRSRLPTPLRAQLENRTTLVLPEDWTLKPPHMGTSGHFEKAAQPHAGSTNRNRRRGNERWASSPKRSVSPHGSSSTSKGRKLSSSAGGGGNSVGAGSSPRSSPASESKGRGGGVGMPSPRRRTRASRVLKTSRDLAQTLRRVHEVGKNRLVVDDFVLTAPAFLGVQSI